MTLSSNISSATFNGNGTTTDFPFDFVVWDSTQLRVYITGADGVSTLTTNWTATLTSTGGNVVYPAVGGTVLPSGESITILRNMPLTQAVDLASGVAFDPAVIEKALDQVAASLQQISEESARGVKVPPGSGTDPNDLLNEIAADVSAAVSSAASSAADAIATAADRVQTGLDADITADGAAVITTNLTALNNVTANLTAIQNASANAATATTKAGEASASAIAAAASAAALPNAASIGAGKVPQSDGATWIGIIATGDMLKADNLSGLANTATARSNLGLAIGTDVLAPSGNGSALTNLPSQLPSQTGNDGAVLRSSGVAASWGSAINNGVVIDTSTGATGYEVTSIPAWAKRIEICFKDVSLSGTDSWLVQLGTGGTPQTTGYVGNTTAAIGGTSSQFYSSTAGFPIYGGNAGNALNGSLVINLFDSANHVYSSNHALGDSAGSGKVGGGNVTLSGVLDMIRVTRTGTNTFDGGKIVVKWS